MERRNLQEIIGCTATRGKQMGDAYLRRGSFHIQRVSPGGIILAEFDVDNLITDEGAKHDFEVFFRSGSQITSWYIGLIDNAGIGVGPAVTDVMNSHLGWVENVNYSEGTRVAWAPTAASGTGTGSRQVTNTSPSVFTMSAMSLNIYGIFITSGSAKSGTTGKLWSAAAFPAVQPFNTGDLCNVTYTLKG